MNPAKLILSAVLTFFAFSVAFSELPFQLGQAVTSGTGCPTGSVSVVVSPDGNEISILFDNFTVSGHKGGNYYLDMRKNCRFQIPLDLQAAYNLQALQIDYRGFAQLPGNHRAYIMTTGPDINMNSFSVGDQDIRTEVRNNIGNFFVSQPLRLRDMSHCLGQQYIEFSTVVQLFGPAPRAPLYLMEDASITIDSADMSANQEAIRLIVRAVPCH